MSTSTVPTMVWLGHIGSFLFLLCGLNLAFGFVTGRVLGRWPYSEPPERETHPGFYKFIMSLYGGGMLAGAILFLQSLL